MNDKSMDERAPEESEQELMDRLWLRGIRPSGQAQGSYPGHDRFPLMTLDELSAKLVEAGLSEGDFRSVERPDGSASHEVSIAGTVRAKWCSKLRSNPVYDGKTRRGPSWYFNLEILPAGQAS